MDGDGDGRRRKRRRMGGERERKPKEKKSCVEMDPGQKHLPLSFHPSPSSRVSPRYCRSRSRHRHLCHRRGWSDRQAGRRTMRGVHACWERGKRKERDTERRREGLKRHERHSTKDQNLLSLARIARQPARLPVCQTARCRNDALLWSFERASRHVNHVRQGKMAP